MPDIINEEFFVEIGYFEPESIKIIGEGITMAFIATLPRLPHEMYEKEYELTKASLNEDDLKMVDD